MLRTNTDQELNAEKIRKRERDFRERCVTIQGKKGNVRFKFNPIVTLASSILIWTIIVWSFVDTESATHLKNAQQWFGDFWTWLYISAQLFWAIFIFYIYFKYGDLKLGVASDKPEHSDLSYAAMILSVGIGVGLITEVVSESITNYTRENVTAINYWGRNSQSNKAQNAINITVFHWGFHAFCVYSIPSVLLSLLAYRKGLPLTMRTCFYPLIGNRIFGRIGDFIDTISIATIFLGVSVSLVLGSKMLLSGINKLNSDIGVSTGGQIITVWSLTVVATVSVILGLHLGVKRASEICFLIAFTFIMTVVLCDNPWYLLDVGVQSVGYYAQYFIGMSSLTGDFSSESNENKAASNFTVFYWGWWISWSPLCGMFIARISRGRLVKELILYSYFVPVLFVFGWISVFGAIAIRMETNAVALNVTCNWYVCDNVIPCKRNPFYAADWKAIEHDNNHVAKLVCFKKQAQFYEVLNNYKDLAAFLKVLSFLSLVFFYSTSADSATLVADTISANGEENPPVIQRVYWGITQGALATAMIYMRNEYFIVFAVIAGLPFIVILMSCCLAILRVLPKEPLWNIELEGAWKNKFGHITSVKECRYLAISFVCPGYYLAEIALIMHKSEKLVTKVFFYVLYTVPFYMWIILMVVDVKVRNANKIGCVFLILFFVALTKLRYEIRVKNGINGNAVEDFLLCLFYPIVVVQLLAQCKKAEQLEVEFYDNAYYVTSNNRAVATENNQPPPLNVLRL